MDLNVAKRRVLLVDDEVEVLKSIRRHLTRRGWDVFITTSPFQALEEAHALKLNAVVSDFKMAGMNGRDLLIRLGELLPGVPRVLLTGYADLGQDTLPQGVQLLSKPCDPLDLMRCCQGPE